MVWTSETAGKVTVEYGPKGAFNLTQTATTQTLLPADTQLTNTVYQYSATLPKLQAGQQYSYRVSLDGQIVSTGTAQSFITPQAGAASFRFLAFGDSGEGCAEQFQLAQMMAQENVDFALHTGDIAYPLGSYQNYQSLYFDAYRDLMQKVSFFPCAGNHDMYFQGGAAYRTVHALPTQGVPDVDAGYYYSFDWANAHFYSLDSNCLAEDDNGVLADRAVRMLKWLEQQLQQARLFWRIPFFHHSPYAVGEHDQEVIPALVRKYIVPLLDKYGVPFILAGHEHSYQRTVPLRGGNNTPASNGAVYITSGGGGGTLCQYATKPWVAAGQAANHYLTVNVQGTTLQLSSLLLNGGVLEPRHHQSCSWPPGKTCIRCCFRAGPRGRWRPDQYFWVANGRFINYPH